MEQCYCKQDGPPNSIDTNNSCDRSNILYNRPPNSILIDGNNSKNILKINFP